MKRAAASILAIMMTSSSFAADGGRTGAQFLLIPGEARGAAMSEAYSAQASGAIGLWYNAAAIGGEERPSLELMHTAYLESVTFNTVSFATPFWGSNAFAVGAAYLNAGTIPSYDNTGQEAPSYSPKDICARLGYAHTSGLSTLGLSASLIRSTILDSAQTFAINAGVRRDMGLLSAALGLENFGGKLTFQNEATDLPRRLRAGLSCRLLQGWTVNADFFKPAPGLTWMATGTEIKFTPHDPVQVALRAGYNTKTPDITGLQGLSVGMGVGWHSAALNYAWIPMGDLGQTHRISLDFSGLEPSDPELTNRDDLAGRISRYRSERLSKALNAKPSTQDALPVYPWKSKSPDRHSTTNVMDQLANDGLCALHVAHAIVTKTQGEVRMKTSRLARWLRALKDQYLFEGDTLRTGADAYAQVVFASGVRAQIERNSQVEIEASPKLCEKSIVSLEEGEIYATAEPGKEIEVKTSAGSAHIGPGRGVVTVEDRRVTLKVAEGAANFSSDGVTVPVQPATMFAKERRTGGDVSVISLTHPIDEIKIADADENNVPGRWDNTYSARVANQIMALSAVPGLMLSEYSRDSAMRDNLKASIQNLNSKAADLESQQAGFKRDVAGFLEMKETLNLNPANESPEERKKREINLRDVNEALAKAMKQMGGMNKDLTGILVKLRGEQEKLAALPVVRMLNITAQESMIPFESSRALIDARAFATLDLISDAIQRLQPVRVVVEGHTDRRGTARANNALSKARAVAVVDYLQKKTSLPSKLFETKGMGSSVPIDPGDTPEAMSKNRRVEIWFEMRGF
jgi:chemotaxis protein MotB